MGGRDLAQFYSFFLMEKEALQEGNHPGWEELRVSIFTLQHFPFQAPSPSHCLDSMGKAWPAHFRAELLSPARETQGILQQVPLFVSNVPKMSSRPCCKRQWHILCVNYRAGVPAHDQEGLENCTFPTLQNGSCEVLTHQVLGNAEIFTYSQMPAWSRDSAWAPRSCV